MISPETAESKSSQKRSRKEAISVLSPGSRGESGSGIAAGGESTPFTAGELLLERFRATRLRTNELVKPLHREDMVVQSMEDTSPTKWHLAHTTWFFETFVLTAHYPDYELFDSDFPYLFNSYYVQAGPRFSRPRRGMITRPTVDVTMDYRRYVDRCMAEFLSTIDETLLEVVDELVTLGINHEQQHQELMMTDIKHVLHQNPLRPAYDSTASCTDEPTDLKWVFVEEGLYEVGRDEDGSFMFDNEGPRHRVFLDSFWLADRLTTAREYLAFIDDGGYERPELWLSAGWATVESQDWHAPIYWERIDGEWHEFTMSGLIPLRMDAPVSHISYFEADAFARWSRARLCTEFEWEVAAAQVESEGNFVESDMLMPLSAPTQSNGAGPVRPRQMYGDLWEWTRSQYSPYPRYSPADGAIGEYNGKFMCNQFVLRGGSCATPGSHIRNTYRNFFPPEARWQYAGIRLAADTEPRKV
ncbi:MAG: ergothioneine biosynthesis protein EgtB [Rhodothermales bacterium]|nr:ergothioneine biosynthesis protein EgtB [Rhodothermales bacterium]